MPNTVEVAAAPDRIPASPRVWYCQVLASSQTLDADERYEGQPQPYRHPAPKRRHVESPTRSLSLRLPVLPAHRVLQAWWHQLSSELAPPMRVRNFRLLFTGQFVSSVGDQFYLVALPWLILDRGGTPQDLGLVLSAYGVPRLAALLAGGKLSDWLRPRSVMLLADVVRALVLLVLTGYALIAHPPLWLLCVIVAPLGLFTGLFLPASYAIAPDLVPVEQLQAANAITGSSLQMARLIGPGLGGIVVGQLRTSVALAADALSFLASIVTLAAIRQDKRHGQRRANATTKEPHAEFREIQESTSVGLWRLLCQSPLLRAVLIFVGLANVTSGGVIEVALPAYAHGPLAVGATGYGLILGAWGAGALLGGLAAGGLGQAHQKGQMMLLVTLGESAGIALAPFAGHIFGFLGVAVDLGAFGVANGLSNVLLISLVQQSFPRHMCGRVMGAFLLAAYGIYPLSVILGGLTAQWLGIIAMFPLAGLALLGAVVYGWVQGTLREMGV